MTDESRDAAFTSFWHRSVDKISSGKVKFMPNVTKPKNSKDEDETTTATAQKQHRRNQVRRAQIEHRKRKQNYVKHLEEDAIRLREMISETEIESSALMKENMAIESTLSASGVTIVRPLSQKLPKPTIFLPPAEYDSFNILRIPDSIQSKRLTIRSIDNETDNDRISSYISEMLTQDKTSSTDYFPGARDISNSSSTSGSHFGIHFDRYIDAPCLHISMPSGNSVRGPRVIDLSKPLPPLPGQASVPQNTSRTPSPDLSLIAINLILALEHPCRTHFHHPPLNPTDTPSGHELMASTPMFAQAPPSAFQDPPPSSESSWYSSSISLSLAQLYAMSRSLPMSDVEITPVQAWFMIAEKYDSEIERVIEGRRIEGLKRGLGGLSRCYQFGAVMDVESFWEVVNEVMGWD
ncbi:hypothetical protein DID88_010233 [Monilinia fructigena]|uniref:BZIP domain-containing protein n=1 Tax=Monilinia fructigena TaxID=38457 RepID=A0A395IMW5_9HELO|nr:hypothetical protein DID88_010233 [Monilinia fructigena]